MAVRWESYACSQRPSAFACSTWASPAGCIAPEAISPSALAQLILDHRLRGPRGVKRWSHQVSSNEPFCPSIQP